ncbi:PASTA domain-containing protein [Mycolicibacterium elephantis]|uniref:PASTA domain-containing protein n=2 Tax=Mycolicibacterium elephantis TaxID=81858 RepID=A0A439DN14_9MYCO|nr:hypothetical protein [Mycolicibacterium elephantis]KKW62166.1 hypothetical protein AAV95_23810 [Mycolicibacterium elephantis]MCV7220263.1 hypothetical protein [Mycolicibacterium elephantis]OBB28048.1 hypothetical protein A5762_05225 [Mycolicibacterium elephantis]OBE96620.1 hypothetical protein A5776_18880 [Mycolicibacterium elephantis]ORA65855.1 hypothetical protein BST23_12700 [Mycolicibacterium elephantis]
MTGRNSLRAGAVASGVAALMLIGTPTAAADYIGQSFADASSEMNEAGLNPIVVTRVGDQLAEDECIVTGAWEPSLLRGVGDGFEYSEDEIMVSLNCAGAYASETNPGASIQHPLGRAAKSEAEEEASEEGSSEEE